MQNTFIDLMKQRRSIYTLSKHIPISEEELIAKIEEVVLHSPTAFNSQSSVVVILLGDNNQKLWKDITQNILEKVTPPEAFPNTIKKMDSFAESYGTILFFDDQRITNELIENYPLYKDLFIPWSEHANGMLQFAIWTMLAEEKIGASLQHYNPLIDEAVKQEFNIDKSLRLIAQMPFGSSTAKVGKKQQRPVSELVTVVK